MSVPLVFRSIELAGDGLASGGSGEAVSQTTIKSYMGHSIPINKKICIPSDLFENWQTFWVHKETTPDQNLTYFDYSPLRYHRSILKQ